MRYSEVKKAYNKATTREEAIAASVLKWEYFSVCTKRQLMIVDMGRYCALCKLYGSHSHDYAVYLDEPCPLVRRGKCPENNLGCYELYGKAVMARYSVFYRGADINIFNTAARALRDKLKTLK